MESENVPTIAFASAAEADRPIAGVAAAARALAAAGARAGLRIGGETPLARATLDDIARLTGAPAQISYGPVARTDARLPTAWQVMRATGKPGDGLVSRWLNRPISQRISWLLLQIKGIRPIHVTLFNALLAVAMTAVLLGGGRANLVLGGILFHAASVLDGIDGEMARATHRASPRGAALDSAVDIATNLLFVAALTIHLALRDGGVIGWIGGWALLLSILGGALIARRVRGGGAPLGFDLFKRSGRVQSGFDLVYRLVQLLTGRDCFAFLYMVLIIAGLERIALMIYAGVGTLWIAYVIGSTVPRA